MRSSLLKEPALKAAVTLVMALGFIVALLVAAPAALGQSSLASKSANLERLSAEWWRWALEKPADESALVGSYSGSVKCDGSNPTRAWFLAGSADGSEVTRTCIASVGTPLFFPVVNTVCTNSWGDGDNARELRDCARNLTDTASADSSAFATIDGQDIPIERVKVRTFNVEVAEDNIFSDSGLPAGKTLAAGDGLYVLAPPLEPGRHTIEFGGTFFGGGFTQDNTYVLTVE